MHQSVVYLVIIVEGRTAGVAKRDAMQALRGYTQGTEVASRQSVNPVVQSQPLSATPASRRQPCAHPPPELCYLRKRDAFAWRRQSLPQKLVLGQVGVAEVKLQLRRKLQQA